MKKLAIIISFCIQFSFVFSQNNPPVAIPDTATITCQDTVAIYPLVNDYDPDGDEFYINMVWPARHGSKSYNDSVVLYRSDYYSGIDSMEYWIREYDDPTSNSELSYLYVIVTENPNLPKAEDDDFSTFEQVPIELNLLQNDSDPNDDEIIFLDILDSPGHGNIDIISDSLILYTPDIYFTGTDSFTYNVIEKDANTQYHSNEATVFITVAENPDIPVATSDQASTITFESININVLFNDTDLNGDEIILMEANDSYNCDIEIISDSSIRYTSKFFVGTDSIRYRIIEKNTDDEFISHWANVYIQVESNPDIPIGIPDSAETLTFTSVDIQPLLNDYDPQNEPFEIFSIKAGNNQLDEITHDGNTITYYTNDATPGIHTFHYRIRETDEPSVYSDWIPIHVNMIPDPELPQAVNDYAETIAGIPVKINIFDNDLNPNNEDSLLVGALGGMWNTNYYGIVKNLQDSIEFTPFFNHKGGIDSIKYGIFKEGFFPPYPLAIGFLIVDVKSNHSYEELTINNIRAGINSNGYLFNNLKYTMEGGVHDYQPAFEAPAGNRIHSIFSSSLWIGGLDEQKDWDSLHFAGERYKEEGEDFWFGPVSNSYDDEYNLKWMQTWKLSKEEIGYHKHHYSDNGYSPIENISTWPGNGDVQSGEAEQLAPFFDINNNGQYEPMLGDYPLIRGDQAIYFIYNDDRKFHSETLGNKLGVEIHGMAYAFNNPNDPVLWNTIFVHYDIINRSDTTYYNTFIGNFTDLDIGHYLDDFVGCNVENGYYYGYNGDDYDETIIELPDTSLGYENALVAQAVAILGGAYMDPDQTDNQEGGCNESINGLNFGDGITDNERLGMSRFVYFNSPGPIVMGDPVVAPYYYNYLNGKWMDGSAIKYGGKGHHSYGSVGPACRYMFPGNSDPLNYGTNCELPNGGYNQNELYWTEEESGNDPNDRRGLGVTGPFTFHPGDVQQLDLAYVFARDYSKSDPVELLKNLIIDLREQVKENNIITLPDSISKIDNSIYQPQIQVYPNPVNSNTIYIKGNFEEKEIQYFISELSGTIVQKGKLNETHIHELQLHGLKKGIYVLHIQVGVKFYHLKIIKL